MRLLFLLFLSSFAFTEEIYVTERLFCPITTFDISNDETPIGTVTKQILSLGTSYYIEDLDSTILASASTRFFSWGTITDIENPDACKICSFEENLWKLPPWTEYRILNAQNETILIAELNIFGTTFSLFEPNDPTHIMATISRPLIHIFRDSWTIDILDKPNIERLIDPNLLTLLAVYQTDKDNRIRFWSDIHTAFGQEFEQYDGRRL